MTITHDVCNPTIQGPPQPQPQAPSSVQGSYPLVTKTGDLFKIVEFKPPLKGADIWWLLSHTQWANGQYASGMLSCFDMQRFF